MAPDDKPIVVAIAVVECDSRFLVGVRPAGVPLAGLAEFPGGKVNPRETPEAAAIRECLEESGLTVEIVEKYFSKTHQYDHGLLEIHFFHCRPVALGNIEQVPSPPFRWVPAHELAHLEFPAANAGLTELLQSRASAESKS